MPQPTNPAEAEKLEEFLHSFWNKQIQVAEEETFDFRHPHLPLARIKKVMKSDPDVKMIGSDAPIIFAKACEIFIQEVTSRAWIIAEQAKRRTLSRADIARALQRSDQFDFLIDIVPRELANEKGRSGPRRATEGEDEGLPEDEEPDEGAQGSGHELEPEGPQP